MPLLILSLISLLLLILLFTLIGSLLVRVPYVPTPHQIIKRMLELAEIKDGMTVYDLGCGDARLLIAAKKKFPNIRAIGYELPLGVWMLARLRIWLSRQRINVHMRDLFTADLRDADVIFTYLLPEIMPKLALKIDSEAQPGTIVISHGFEIKDRTPVHMERVPLPRFHLMRPKGQVGPRVFVYKW